MKPAPIANTPSPSALRMRSYRDRREAGYRVVSIEVHQSTIDQLVDSGLLPGDEREDKGSVSNALVELLASTIREDSALGRCAFDLAPRQIDILVRRGFLDQRAREDGNQIRKAFAEFVHEAFARGAKLARPFVFAPERRHTLDPVNRSTTFAFRPSHRARNLGRGISSEGADAIHPSPAKTAIRSKSAEY